MDKLDTIMIIRLSIIRLSRKLVNGCSEFPAQKFMDEVSYMAVADRSIDPKLIQSAKEEFLRSGFKDASLTRICNNAGVTTGALYKRFKGKEDLFSTLVENVVDILTQYIENKGFLLQYELPDEVLVCCWEMNEELTIRWFDLLEAHRTEFTLLMRCAEGTKYEKVEHEFCERMTEQNYQYYRRAFERGIATAVISKKELHVFDSTYWKSICEPFIHDFTYEEIRSLNKHLCHFFSYHELLGIPHSLIEQYREFDFSKYLQTLL